MVGPAPPSDYPSTPTDGRRVTMSPYTSPTPGSRFRNGSRTNPNLSPSDKSDDHVLPTYRGTVPQPNNDDEGEETESEEFDDDNGTVSTEDPVRLAMGATLDENDDDEEEMEDERVLYPQQRTSSSPLM